MAVLILGLVLFLGTHSIRIVADGARNAAVARIGRGGYMLVYSLLSLIGIWLITSGYDEARLAAGPFWSPPPGLSHLALILVPVSFVLVVAAYAPTGRIKSAAAHPMALGVAVFAAGHLLANGATADLVLFGSFLVWGVADFLASYRRTGGVPATGSGRSVSGDLSALVIGLAVAAVFVFGLHQWLFGVSPLG